VAHKETGKGRPATIQKGPPFLFLWKLAKASLIMAASLMRLSKKTPLSSYLTVQRFSVSRLFRLIKYFSFDFY